MMYIGGDRGRAFINGRKQIPPSTGRREQQTVISRYEKLTIMNLSYTDLLYISYHLDIWRVLLSPTNSSSALIAAGIQPKKIQFNVAMSKKPSSPQKSEQAEDSELLSEVKVRPKSGRKKGSVGILEKIGLEKSNNKKGAVDGTSSKKKKK